MFPLGLDPHLRGATFAQATRALTGFAGATRCGYYGRGKEVRSGTVSSALTAIGKKITLVQREDFAKLAGSKTFLPRIQEMLDGFKKDDPSVTKMPPCTIDLPEEMGKQGMKEDAT